MTGFRKEKEELEWEITLSEPMNDNREIQEAKESFGRH